MKNYSKSTTVAEVVNKIKFTTSKTDQTIDAKQTEVNPTVINNQNTSVKTNSTVSKDQTLEVVTTISNTILATKKNIKLLNGFYPKIDLDKNKTNTLVKNTSKTITPTHTSKTVENANKHEETKIDTSTNDNEVDTPSEKYSRNFIYMVVTLLVFCLCCCYFFVWRYSKLPLFPFKNHTNFMKGVLTEKSPIEN